MVCFFVASRGHFESRLDLNKWLIKRPAAIFMVSIEDNSIIIAGIQGDNVAIVNRPADWTISKPRPAMVDKSLTALWLCLQVACWKGLGIDTAALTTKGDER